MPIWDLISLPVMIKLLSVMTCFHFIPSQELPANCFLISNLRFHYVFSLSSFAYTRVNVIWRAIDSRSIIFLQEVLYASELICSGAAVPVIVVVVMLMVGKCGILKYS